ncbi:MAG TPA: DUF4159 domain-containing protein [Bryobacteraceae bacterium]|jgi:hypothetical protein|nr:DUF4159 domain-containing protein [Bryobacteraceae bacterium]
MVVVVMRRASLLVLIVAGLSAWGILHAQRPFKQYEATEYDDFPLPGDYQQATEWTRARLHYTSVYGRYRRGYDLNWTIDYPRSDRHLLQGVRRLTRIDSRSVEQVVDLDGGDDVYNWPMMYAVEVGHWVLADDEAAQLRDFLLRGGFLMVDDFHGSDQFRGINEWAVFAASMSKVFPDRPIVDLENRDPIFHTIYDLSDRVQVPGWQWTRSGLTYEKGETGRPEHWRAIFDDKGRVMVAICHNMDLGDAWEWSDDPRYPEKWASLAYRIAMNYFVYDLTH